MAEWYVQQGQNRVGPVSEEVVRTMAGSGQIAPTDLVWSAGMPTWEAAGTQAWYREATGGQVPPIAPPLPPSAQVPPPAGYPQGAYPQQPVIGYANLQGLGGPPVPNYLPWAVAVLILCCMPGGIVALIYASKANTEAARGNIAVAQQAASTAKTWIIVSVVVGLVFGVLAVLAGLLSPHSSY